MKRLFGIVGLIALTVSSVWAVKPVVLESGETSTAFIGPNAFINAYNAADDGDIIYLPGFQFSVPNPFEKDLTIYGAGYHPDHTGASGQSMLTGTFNLRAGASGSHFEGIRFSGQIVFAAQKITDITFRRCYFNSSINLNGLEDDNSENITISESVLTHQLTGHRTIFLTLNNNIIHARQSAILQYIRSGWIVNNIIIGAVGSNVNSAVLRFVYDSIIENNIIYNTVGSFRVFSSLDNNTLRNNVISLTSLLLSGNTLDNNYLDVDIPALFADYPGDDFSFDGDYNLVDPDPDAYQGTTGNQVGIYGGISPKKANTRPSNPQILSVEIGHGTDDQGMLHVELEVEAQEQ